MEKTLSLLAILVIAMFVFGCTSSGNYSANYSTGNTSNTTTPPAPSVSQNTSATTPTGTSQPTGTPSSGTTPSGTSPSVSNATSGTGAGAGTQTSGPTTPPSADLSGKNYSGLINTGTPSQCTLTYSPSSGGQIKLNLYFDGRGSMRMEQPNTGLSDCPSTVLVFKGDSTGNGTLFFTCPENKSMLGTDFNTDAACDWTTMGISTEYGGIGESTIGAGDYSSPMIGDEPASEYICQPWTLDSSKFSTPGFVCNQ